MVTKAEATAEVFVMALKSLSNDERDAVLARIAQEKSLSRDLLDLALIAQRSGEPSRPFREYLAEKRGE